MTLTATDANLKHFLNMTQKDAQAARQVTDEMQLES